ncbi:hypothetical protein PSTG_14390 [Puccinia striiformis f. sp. tritici PST-78]|uniref:Uncharacterized protein n=1 Tax=Puccinia striiformis f. sp. tritici PST-78 TaxID=1165861 RepID=A0A0L0UYX0_9BASI|nr:hypothetical protein PSTG_14390 [Puccinia striiformis f. sp. tritici PST-78]
MSLCSINLCLHFFFLINRAVARPGPTREGTEVVRVNGFLDLNKPPPDEALTAALFPSQPPAEPLRAFGADHIVERQEAKPYPPIAAEACSSASFHKRQRDDLGLESKLLPKRRKKTITQHQAFASAEDLEINTAEDSHQKPSASQTTKQAPTSTEGSDVKLNAKHDKNTPLNFNKETYTVLNVHNWKFVQNNREEENTHGNLPAATEKSSIDKLFEFLHKVRYNRKLTNKSIENGQRFFSLPRHNTGLFLKRYARYRNQVCYPVADDAHRISFIFENVLKIADEKFGLKRSDTFLKEMEDSLAINLKSARNSPSKGAISTSPIATVIRYAEKLNRSATVLIVLYLTLFEGHQEGRLTTELIESILSFLGDFWRKIMQQDESELSVGEKRDFLGTLNRIVHFKKGASKNTLGKSHILYMAWNIVRFWVKTQDFFSFRIISFHKQDHHNLIKSNGNKKQPDMHLNI